MSSPARSQRNFAKGALTPREISDHMNRLAAAEAYVEEREELNKIEEHKQAIKKRGLQTRSNSAKTMAHSLEDLSQQHYFSRGDKNDEMKCLFQTLSRELKDSINTSMNEAAARIQDSLEASLKEAINASVAREMVPVNTAIESLTERIEDLEADLLTLAEERKIYFQTNENLTRQLIEQGKKIDDLENRTRRNNLKIRGIPSAIQHNDLKNYLKHLFAQLLDMDNPEIIKIDRAHRLGIRNRGPSRFTTRDVICCLQSFEIKTEILAATRLKSPIRYKDAELQIFGDFSKRTSDRRRMLRPITEELRKHGLKYKWGFPLSIMVMKDGNYHTLEDGDPIEPFLIKIGLDPLSIEGWTYDVPVPDSANTSLRCEAWRKKGGKQSQSNSPEHSEQAKAKTTTGQS